MNRRRNIVTKNLKDYFVPIIGLFLILLLIFSMFSWWDNQDEILENENRVGIDLVLDTQATESYIIYPGDSKKIIEWDMSVYKGEKIMVKNWSVSFDFWSMWAWKLEKLWELKYTESGDLALYSSDFWLNSKSKTTVNMRYANVEVWENSHISFSQNEMWSTVYLLNGFAEVTNLAWKNSLLLPGKKITISRSDASNDDIDMTLLKTDIDDYFKQSDWFIKNNGAIYINMDIETGSGATKEVINTWTITSIIKFNTLSDESYVSESSITIAGNYSDNTIEKITVNGIKALLNKTTKTFSFENVDTNKMVNDLIFKVYDDSEDVIAKILYTVYYNKWTSNTGWFEVKTFSVDASDFKFSSPSSTGIFTTYDNFVTIRWNVSNENVSSVTVNNYLLKSYNWSTWRYHASQPNNNLQEGTNVYEVNYYDANQTLLYMNTFTIVKKIVNSIIKEEVPEKITENFSDEV